MTTLSNKTSALVAYAGLAIIVSCLLLVDLAHSAPTAAAGAPTTNTGGIITDQANFVDSDDQLEALIRRLDGEHQDSIKANPLNYVADDVPIEQLISALDAGGDVQATIEVEASEVATATTPLPFAEQQAEELLDSIDRATSGHLAAPVSTNQRNFDESSDDEDEAQLERRERRRRQIANAETGLVPSDEQQPQPQQQPESTTTNPNQQQQVPPVVFTNDYVSADADLEEIMRLIGLREQQQQQRAASDPEQPTREPFAQPVEYTDEEYERLLKQLEQDAIESNQHPDNFANDDADLQRIIEFIESHEDAICPICHDDLPFNDPEAAQIVNCGHTFHRDCLHDWYNSIETGRRSSVRKCPYCRQDYQSSRVKTKNGDWR